MTNDIQTLKRELHEKEMHIMDLQNKIVWLNSQNANLKHAKLSIKEIIKVNGGNSTNEMLQIINVHQTPNGVIVEVS